MPATQEWKSEAGHEARPEQYSYAFFAVDDKEETYAMPGGFSSTKDPFAAWVSENSNWVCPEDEVIRLLVDKFKQVPEVESIWAQFMPNNTEIAIWTILESHNSDARSLIHKKELEICRALNMFDFDFRVTSADIVPPNELDGNGLWEVYNRSRSADG